MSSPLRKMQAVVPWANSGVAMATVLHLLARRERVDGIGCCHPLLQHLLAIY